MSLHQTNKDKPRAQKCRHFCFSFDLHNYCPTCREAGKGDDPCVTFETPCHICASFTDEQMKKIQNRKRYLKKQKAESSSKDNELDLLGEGDRIPSLAQMQTSRVLLTIFLPHPPVLSHLPSVLYRSKHQPSLSHPPQVQLYNIKFKQILKNPWEIP